MKATGWQAHSVRGFLSGHLKEDRRPVQSSLDDAGPVRYRIEAVASEARSIACSRLDRSHRPVATATERAPDSSHIALEMPGSHALDTVALRRQWQCSLRAEALPGTARSSSGVRRLSPAGAAVGGLSKAGEAAAQGAGAKMASKAGVSSSPATEKPEPAYLRGGRARCTRSRPSKQETSSTGAGTYRSLSVVAREITGTHHVGTEFFLWSRSLCSEAIDKGHGE